MDEGAERPACMTADIDEKGAALFGRTEFERIKKQVMLFMLTLIVNGIFGKKKKRKKMSE